MSANEITMHRLVVKVGTSVLSDRSGRLLPERLDALARELAACSHQKRQVLLVSSGAIACGMAALGLTRRPAALAQLQACAAVGQGELMHLYSRAFAPFKQTIAQVLLTQEDLAEQRRFRNAKQTLLTLLHRGVVPIVNENDTVAVEEIAFGDNDRLAALVACAIDAQLLVLLSDVDGLMKDGRLVERIEGLDEEHYGAVQDVKRNTTKGGMVSKLDAARIVGSNGIPMVIANGRRSGVLTALLAGQPLGTLFVPAASRLGARKWWIAFSLRQPKGQVVIDPGAAQALLERGKSLLASGVQNVSGRFEAGACVSIVDADGRELARGVCNYSAADLARVRGMKSDGIAKALGIARAPEVAHRDHIVLASEFGLRHGNGGRNTGAKG